MGDSVQKPNRENFHKLYGGENAIVDRPEELTPDAIDYLANMEKDISWKVIRDLDEHGRRIPGLFRTDLLETAYEHMLSRDMHAAAGAGLSMILFYCMNESPDTLPPYANLAEADSVKGSQRNPTDEFQSILLFISHNGFIVPVYLSSKMLERYERPELKIDGFVESMMVIGKGERLKVAADGKDIRTFSRSSIYYREGSHLSFSRLLNDERTEFGSGGLYADDPVSSFHFRPVMDLFCETEHDFPIAYSSDFDFCFQYTQTGDFRNSRPSERYDIDINGYRLSIYQIGLKPIEELGFERSSKGVDIVSQTDPARLKDIPGIDEIVTGIDDTVSRLESQFRMNLVDRIYLADFNVANAQALFRDKNISISFGLMKKDPLSIPVIVEHELIHFILDSTPAQFSMKFRQYLEANFGVPIIPPPAIFEQDRSGPFLDFIRESKFLDDEKYGGHPSDFFYEFAESFTHTLFYFNRLIEKLDSLSEEQREEFVDHYINICDLLSKGDGPTTVSKFFERHAEVFRWIRDNGIDAYKEMTARS